MKCGIEMDELNPDNFICPCCGLEIDPEEDIVAMQWTYKEMKDKLKITNHELEQMKEDLYRNNNSQLVERIEERLNLIAINSLFGPFYTIKDLKKVERKLLNKEILIDLIVGSAFFAKVMSIDITNNFLQVELQSRNDKHVYVDLCFDNIHVIKYFDKWE